MWSQQIFVALVCAFLTSQQVAAVVNNGQSAKTEEQKTSTSENVEANKSDSNEADASESGTENTANRREAPVSLGDVFGGPPIAVAVDSYLPSGQGNVNLPVPVYGVPDAPSNNIVYPAPPPDIPPAVAIPVPTYGLPQVSGTYGVPVPVDSYGPPVVKFETVPLTPPKLIGGGRGTKPPRPQYGVPPKPHFPSKFPIKHPYKSNLGVHKHTKPLSTYGPPSGYFKDNYSPSKFNVNFNNIFSDAHNHVSHQAFAGQASHAILTQQSVPSVAYAVPNGLYGVPNVAVQTHGSNLNLIGSNAHGISGNYGAPEISIEIVQGNTDHGGQALSTQYGPPNGDVLGPPKPHYGPPQPSPHPKPPHPGAPAPPTPPDIKYDGWQPIPGLVSRAPTTSYGVPPSGSGHSVGHDKDLVPPPLAQDSHYESSSSYGGSSSYSGSQSDSYGAPLNTVTGSGGIVSSSGEEVHGQHLSHSGTVDIDVGHGGNSGKDIGIDIYTSGLGSIGGHSHSSNGLDLQIGDTYGAPPSNSYSPSGPYAVSHAHSNLGSSSLGLGSFDLHSSQNSHAHNNYNSHKSHGYKALSVSNSGRGLIPPSGVYGASTGGHYGTPLFTNSAHGPPLNALKINPPRHPVVHKQPIPPGVFQSITKQNSHSHGHSHSSSNHHGFSSSYLPPISTISKPIKDYGPPLPSTLYSLPNAHSSISFQNFAHGSSSAGLLNENLLHIDGATSSALSSYNAPLNIVDGSYNIPQSHGHLHSQLNGEIVGLDLTHPTVTIDLTHNGHSKHSFPVPQDCSLKSSALPSLSYGVPSVNSYTASLSSLTTNIGAGHQANLISLPQHYGPPPLQEPVAEISYEVSESHGDSGHDYDLSTAHSQKVSSEAKINSVESESQGKYSVESESQGKSYGKSVAESFGPHSELLQSQSLDLNNIALQGALGSYTLQIQSADGSQGEVAHGQVLNEGLLQSILAAIEQPEKNNGQPIIQLQKSLEQQNFVTNDSIPTVVGKLADQQIEHSSAPVQYVVEPSNEVLTNVNEKIDDEEDSDDDSGIPVVDDNAIALYFSNKGHRSKKETDEATAEENESDEDAVLNSH